MIDGITYFRKSSPYVGDVTKNCGLDGYEVDNNFFVLEGRDAKTVQVIGNDIVITLLNGDSLRAVDAFKDVEVLKHSTISNIDFDKEKGILKVTKDGEVINIGGFSTILNTGVTVAVNDTLHGTGIPSDPVGLASPQRTGQYRPVNKFLSVVDGDKLPCDCKKIKIGERYVTKEAISDYGYLYNYNAIQKIACDLAATNSPWRIPTKEDWDSMLNAVEPCHGDRNHSSVTANRYLGRWSGKLLKSTDLWKHKGSTETCGCGAHNTCIDYGEDEGCNNHHNCNCQNNNPCEEPYCGKRTECHCDETNFNTDGLDAFGFRVTPAGYAVDCNNYVFFGERAFFWSATNSKCENVYAKRFEFNKNSVYQNIIDSQNYLSLRLVKDYTGNNYHENEEILSEFYPTVLMPSLDNGKSIWTSINVSFKGQCGCYIKPNLGKDLSSSIHYYVNEWNGKRWLRNELREGDSVVIINAPNDKKDVEYRVVGSDFIDVPEMTYDEVINNVQPKLDALENKINDEISRSTQKDDEISNTIDNELRPSIKKNSEDIATVNDNLVKAIVNINKSIETVNNALVVETEERKAADGVLGEKIEENKTNLENEITRSTEKDREHDAKDKELEESIRNNHNESDSRYHELTEKVNANKESIDNLNIKTDKTNEDLKNTNKVLSDFGKETGKAFEQLNKVIYDGFNTINGGIATEIKERKDADDEIRGTILTEEGTKFDTTNGILTLKSKDATNDIKVQFEMNFGEF